MGRAGTRSVPIILAMIVGLLLLPLQGRATQREGTANDVQLRNTCGEREAQPAAVARPRVELRRDAIEDADDAAPPRACGVSDASSAGVMVLAAPTMRTSLVRADRPRARGPP